MDIFVLNQIPQLCHHHRRNGNIYFLKYAYHAKSGKFAQLYLMGIGDLSSFACVVGLHLLLDQLILDGLLLALVVLSPLTAENVQKYESWISQIVYLTRGWLIRHRDMCVVIFWVSRRQPAKSGKDWHRHPQKVWMQPAVPVRPEHPTNIDFVDQRNLGIIASVMGH